MPLHGQRLHNVCILDGKYVTLVTVLLGIREITGSSAGPVKGE